MTKEKGKANDDAPLTPDICSDFTGGNGAQVAFQNVPGTGCTLAQNGANNAFPFIPSTQGANGLREANIYPGDILTIAVPTPRPYTYLVSCCPQNTATHTVTVP
jgi:hypothetical protein